MPDLICWRIWSGRETIFELAELNQLISLLMGQCRGGSTPLPVFGGGVKFQVKRPDLALVLQSVHLRDFIHFLLNYSRNVRMSISG